MRPLIGFFVAVAVALPGSALAGGVCIVVDTERDNLDKATRSAARMLLLDAFEQEKVDVDRSGSACSETYKVHHIKLGQSINITISGPKGVRKARSAHLEELPMHYNQMVRSLLTGEKITTGSNALTRKNVTSDQMAPRRASADSLWYIRLGYAGVIGKGFHDGPAMGFGYRFELDHMGIDVSGFNILLATDDGDEADGALATDQGVTGSWIKLMALYFSDPLSNHSLYAGGGLSWGATAIRKDGENYTESGLQGEGAIGYEFLRASTLRMTTSLEVTLPFYSTDGLYTPTIGLYFGVGWGKANALRIVQ